MKGVFKLFSNYPITHYFKIVGKTDLAILLEVILIESVIFDAIKRKTNVLFIYLSIDDVDV